MYDPMYHKRYREAHREQRAASNKRYRETHRDQIAASKKKWEEEHREQFAATKKRYARAHRELQAASNKRYAEAHPEQFAASKRRYYESHLEKYKAYSVAYRRLHPEVHRAIWSRRKARERGAAISTFTAKEWAAMKLAYGSRCAYCRKKKKLTQDHVIPLSKGGNHCASNIVPACLICNSKKGVREAPSYQPVLFILPEAI